VPIDMKIYFSPLNIITVPGQVPGQTRYSVSCLYI
jgi:hypothetical protein